MKDLYFITSNKGKYKEVANKLIEADFKVIQKNLGYPEVQANSLEDVVNFGVSYILERFHKPFIIEDAGIFIKNLNDFPGVYSADVFYKIGCKGILKLLDGIKKDRGACFKSVIAYVNSDKQIHVFMVSRKIEVHVLNLLLLMLIQINRSMFLQGNVLGILDLKKLVIMVLVMTQYLSLNVRIRLLLR